jgi:hypothetical protein
MSKAATKTTGQDAAQELEQARRGVQDLLDRIKDGDEKVGPEDLEKAESRVRFARARLEGEERRREEEAERERLRRIEQLQERAAKELDPAPIRKLREKAEEAMSAYVAACVKHDDSVHEIGHELATLGPLPDDVRTDPAGTMLRRAAGREVNLIRPMVQVSDIARSAYRRHVERGYVDLEKPY